MTPGKTESAAVVGGGIAGLAAAYELQQSGVHVTVYEASSRWGGKIFSSLVGGRFVDAGPDTFLARASEGVELCAELGLTEELVAPVSPVPAYIHRDRRLHPLPSGTILGIPTDFDAVAQSGLLSPAGLERAKLDLTLPKTPISDDCSLGWFCRQRLGDEATERLVDPLLGGINASNIDDLSIDAAFPALAEVARSHSSLVTGLRERKASVGATLGSAQPSSTSNPQPVFYSLPGGMAQLVERLVDRLSDPQAATIPPVDLRLNTPVTDLDAIPADGLVLATPSFRAAELLKTSHPELSRRLAGIRYTSVAQATFEFAQTAPYPALDASGILFPRVDGYLATAATWLSTKWSHYAADNRVLIRVSSGRANDTRSETYDDQEVQDRLLADLGTVVDIGQPPLSTRLQRWPQAFPQYSPGHRTVSNQIHAALTSKPGRPLSVAGAAYDGIGIPACIRSGRQAAKNILQAELG